MGRDASHATQAARPMDALVLAEDERDLAGAALDVLLVAAMDVAVCVGLLAVQVASHQTVRLPGVRPAGREPTAVSPSRVRRETRRPSRTGLAERRLRATRGSPPGPAAATSDDETHIVVSVGARKGWGQRRRRREAVGRVEAAGRCFASTSRSAADPRARLAMAEAKAEREAARRSRFNSRPWLEARVPTPSDRRLGGGCTPV